MTTRQRRYGKVSTFTMVPALAAVLLFGCSVGWDDDDTPARGFGTGSSSGYGRDAGADADASAPTRCEARRLPTSGKSDAGDGYGEGETVKAATARDVNGDGHVDLVVADASGFRVYANDDRGVLAPLERVLVGQMDLQSVQTGDFDGDGHVDLLLVGARTLGIALGVGDGTFATSKWTHLDAKPTYAEVVSLGGDGRDDVLARVGTKAVTYEGVAGMLTEARATFVGTDQLAAGDFDGDGHVDLAVVGVTDVLFYAGDGVGGFTRASSSPSGGYAHAVFAADMDGDGHVDLVVSRSGLLVTHLGRGDGRFGEALFSQRTDMQGEPVLADVDGDGKLDALGRASRGGVVVSKGTGLGTLGAPIAYTLDPDDGYGQRAWAVTLAGAADFDEDGRADVIAISQTLGVLLLDHGCR